MPLKPYYEHAGITIYHGDCREILPSLEENSVDLLLTDPPYGVNWQSHRRNKRFDFIAGDDSTEAAEIAIPLALHALKNRRHGYVFGRYTLTGASIAGRTELVWDKGNQGGGDHGIPWRPQHEYIQFFACCKSSANATDGHGNLAARLRRGTVLRVPRLNSCQVRQHPTEKPVRLLRELIEMSSRFEEVVLDPFAGSGSTLVAAHLENRRAIGIEIEEKYCEIAAKRLSQEVFDFGEVGT